MVVICMFFNKLCIRAENRYDFIKSSLQIVKTTHILNDYK